jgi:hypothetical protein
MNEYECVYFWQEPSGTPPPPDDPEPKQTVSIENEKR